MSGARLKFWGWGYESERLTAAEVGRLEAAYAAYFRVSGFDAAPLARPVVAREAAAAALDAARGGLSLEELEELVTELLDEMPRGRPRTTRATTASVRKKPAAATSATIPVRVRGIAGCD